MDAVFAVGVAARIAVGVVLMFAGISKVRSRRWSLLALEMGTPKPVVVTLPAVEVILGLALVTQLGRPVVPWLSVALFVAFLAVVSAQFASKSTAPCNCFGGREEAAVSSTTLARNLFLIAVAVAGALL